MLITGNDVFLRLPSESQKRLLHPGVVVGLAEGGYRVCFTEVDLVAELGQDVLVYYTLDKEFVKQSARIESIEVGGDGVDESDLISGRVDGPEMAIALSGEPVSAESRQCFRVSTVIGNHMIRLDDEPCKLLDVSFTGFAVQTTRVYEVGRVLETGVVVNGDRYSGRVCVQSLTELPTGLIRYGLYCTDEGTVVDGLIDGLQKLSMAIQREQLTRLSGV